jgi:hydrogenase nickel incorporation protein HypB
MCDTCGCGEVGHTHSRTIRLGQDVLAKNDHLAEHNRAWLAVRDVLAVNLMSSPGSGKTSLLERTARERPLSVVEGDQDTPRDADRIRAAGAAAVQINTGTGCHLDAEMVGRALRELDPPHGSLVFLENVGNLVCPALFDLGERAKVVLFSVPEGEDKPLKYPHMFRAADLVLLNKVDLLPHLTFDLDECLAHLYRVNPHAKVLQVSVLAGDGMDEWHEWLDDRMALLSR